MEAGFLLMVGKGVIYKEKEKRICQYFMYRFIYL